MRGARIIFCSIRCDMLVSRRMTHYSIRKSRQSKVESSKSPTVSLSTFGFSLLTLHSKRPPPLEGVGEHLVVGELEDRPRGQTARQPGDADACVREQV